MILDNLPLLKGYKYQIKEDSDIVISANSMKTIYRQEDLKGWILFLKLKSNSPSLILIIETDKQRFEESISQLNTEGLTIYNPYVPYVTTYDTTNDVYHVLYTPDRGRSFKQKNIVTLANETNSNITVSYEYVVVEVINESLLRKSFLGLLKGV